MFSVHLATSDRGRWAVVTLCGELDVMDAAAVAAALAAAAGRGRVVIADLAGLTFIDASGVAALARARRHARHSGGDLLLAAPQRQVRRILTVAQPADASSVRTDVAEAIGSMGDSTAVASAAALPVLLPGN
jgi:anti-sigma B factor antagonist